MARKWLNLQFAMRKERKIPFQLLYMEYQLHIIASTFRPPITYNSHVNVLCACGVTLEQTPRRFSASQAVSRHEMLTRLGCPKYPKTWGADRKSVV